MPKEEQLVELVVEGKAVTLVLLLILSINNKWRLRPWLFRRDNRSWWVSMSRMLMLIRTTTRLSSASTSSNSNQTISKITMPTLTSNEATKAVIIQQKPPTSSRPVLWLLTSPSYQSAMLRKCSTRRKTSRS